MRASIRHARAALLSLAAAVALACALSACGTDAAATREVCERIAEEQLPVDAVAAVLWDRRMAEYDAFGRRKGENPLEQVESAPASAAPPPPANRSRLPTMLGIAAVVVVLSIGLSITLLAAGGSEQERAGPVDTEPQAAPPGDGPPAPQAAPPGAETPDAGRAPGYETPPAERRPARAPRGLERGSLLTQPVLARAVRALRVAEHGQPVSLRVEASRVDAQLVSRRGLLRFVQVGPDGVPRERQSVQAGGVPSMPWSAVDPAAPQRLVRAAAEREDRTAADVDYLVLMGLGRPTWGLFFKGGTHYQGDSAGRLLRRVSP